MAKKDPKQRRKTIEERGQMSVTLPRDFIKWIEETARSSGVCKGTLLRECALAGRNTVARRVRREMDKGQNAGGNQVGK